MEVTLRRIRDDILDRSVGLTDVLREAKVLAYRLGEPEFKRWVDQELNGYFGEDVEVPDYRTNPARNVGTFVGFGGAIAKNVPISTFPIPEHFHEFVETIQIRDGVASLESLAASEEYVHRLPWHDDLVAAMGDVGRFVNGYALISAWQPLPTNLIELILDTIRNRLLTFVLELEERFPEAADSEEAAANVPAEQTHTMVLNIIYGGGNVLASGSGFTQQVKQGIEPGDLSALVAALRDLGLPNAELETLREAIQEDGPPEEGGEFGAHVRAWIGRIAQKTVDGTLGAATSLTVQQVTKAIARYYGLELQ